jgi:hypothetical protein
MPDLWYWKTLGAVFALNDDKARQSAIDVPQEKWKSLATFALSHLVAPELYHQLLRLNVLQSLPSNVADALEGTAELNAILHDDLRTTFKSVVEIANGLGMTPAILKGGIDIVSPADAVNASRMVSDLDILVGVDDARPLYDALLQGGFYTEEMPSALLNYSLSQGRSHHFPPLWHPEIRQYVEIHAALGRDPAEIALTAALREGSQTRRDLGIEFKVPSYEYRLSHNAVHHFIHHRALQTDERSFRQALDFARLAKQLQHESSKQPIFEITSKHEGIRGAFRVSASFASDLFDATIPHSPLTSSELRAEQRFWARGNNPILDWIYRIKLFVFSQFSRLQNWRKIFDVEYVAFKTKDMRQKLSQKIFPRN